MTQFLQMTSVGQSLSIILEVNYIEISTHTSVVAIRGHFQKVDRVPRSGTSIFDHVFLEILFCERAHATFVSDLPRATPSLDYTEMGRMVASWIRFCQLKITMWLTHICLNLITQGFVSPCHICYILMSFYLTKRGGLL
jgi:hypothetical protein